MSLQLWTPHTNSRWIGFDFGVKCPFTMFGLTKIQRETWTSTSLSSVWNLFLCVSKPHWLLCCHSKAGITFPMSTWGEGQRDFIRGRTLCGQFFASVTACFHPLHAVMDRGSSVLVYLWVDINPSDECSSLVLVSATRVLQNNIHHTLQWHFWEFWISAGGHLAVPSSLIVQSVCIWWMWNPNL